MRTPVRLLLISGSMGAGKTTIMGEASDLLQEARIAHAILDFDCLTCYAPQQPNDPAGADLGFRNLASIWPNYEALGVDRFIIASVVETRAEIDRYRSAIPGAEPVVCRLQAPIATMHDRLRQREPGIYQAKFLARSTELDRILQAAAVEDFVVDNGPERSSTDAAQEMLTAAGWL
jgi:hypothetical protein